MRSPYEQSYARKTHSSCCDTIITSNQITCEMSMYFYRNKNTRNLKRQLLNCVASSFYHSINFNAIDSTKNVTSYL